MRGEDPREQLAARRLDASDDLALDPQRPEQPVEVGDDDDARLTVLDRLDRSAQPFASIQRHPAGDVDLLMDCEQLPSLTLAVGSDTIPLLGRAQRFLTTARLAHDPHGAHGGRLLPNHPGVSTTGCCGSKP